MKRHCGEEALRLEDSICGKITTDKYMVGAIGFEPMTSTV